MPSWLEEILLVHTWMQGMTMMANAVAVIEIARVDGSMSTFLLVHSYLAMLTIGLLVSLVHMHPLLHRS